MHPGITETRPWPVSYNSFVSFGRTWSYLTMYFCCALHSKSMPICPVQYRRKNKCLCSACVWFWSAAYIDSAVPWLCGERVLLFSTKGTVLAPSTSTLLLSWWGVVGISLCSRYTLPFAFFCLWKMAGIVPLQAADFCLCCVSFFWTLRNQ